MGRIITDLPDDLDPIILIRDKMLTCPICGTKIDWEKCYLRKDTCWMDSRGKEHTILESLNKYGWVRYKDLSCSKCGCKWDTGWFPGDRKMFQVEINDDKNTINKSIKQMIKKLGLNIQMSSLTNGDLQELEDRFGSYVRFVVEDMLSGKEARFKETTYTTTTQ